MRLIAVEEAFATRPQLDALAEVTRAAGRSDGDYALALLQTAGSAITRQLLDLEAERIENMDAAGIDMSLLLLTAPGVQMFDPASATAIARQANDAMAELVSRRPDRFAALAAIAPQDPEAAAREIERAVTELGLRGVVVNSHTDGLYLCEPRFAPILEAAEALGAAIYIHPRSPIPAMAEAYRPDNLEHAIWGFQAETALHGLRLITGGVFDRYPGLQIVLGHAGEGLPFWLDRIDLMHAKPRGRPLLQHAPGQYFRTNFTVTTSGMNWPHVVRFITDVLGSERVMFAADYPYQPMAPETALFAQATLTPEERADISHRTAERVFGL